MGTVHTAAAAVDTAIANLNSALATFIADVQTARSAAISAAGMPTGGQASIPMYEDPGSYIRAVLGQTALTVTLLKGIDYSNTSGVTVAGQIPSAD